MERDLVFWRWTSGLLGVARASPVHTYISTLVCVYGIPDTGNSSEKLVSFCNVFAVFSFLPRILLFRFYFQ